TDAAGVVPNNELTRHNINLRLTNKLTERLNLDTRLTYMGEKIQNKMPQSNQIGAESPMRHPYRMARNIRTEDAEEFEFFDDDGVRHQHYWYPGYNPANPYWVINRATRLDNKDRISTFASLRYS